MSDGRRKKSVNGGAPAQTISDDRRSSLPEVEASPPAGKRAVIKSADMKDDMQKEAIDIAISVSLSLSLIFSDLLLYILRFLGVSYLILSFRV